MLQPINPPGAIDQETEKIFYFLQQFKIMGHSPYAIIQAYTTYIHTSLQIKKVNPLLSNVDGVGNIAFVVKISHVLLPFP